MKVRWAHCYQILLLVKYVNQISGNFNINIYYFDLCYSFFFTVTYIPSNERGGRGGKAGLRPRGIMVQTPKYYCISAKYSTQFILKVLGPTKSIWRHFTEIHVAFGVQTLLPRASLLLTACVCVRDRYFVSSIQGIHVKTSSPPYLLM